MHKLTKIDKIAITELLNNSRVSIKDISKRHGISRGALHKRIKVLEEEKILGEYGIDFNPSKIGVIAVDILLKTKKVPNLDSIKKMTKKIPSVARCILCTGPYNVQFRCYVIELEDIQEIIGNLNKLLDIIEFIYLLPLERTFFLRDFFNLGFNINKIEGPFYHNPNIKSNLNRLSLEILTELSKNSRTSIMEIAKNINRPITTVNFNFQKLKKEKVIEKFSSFIRAANFGYDIDHIKITINSDSTIINKKMLDFCLKTKNIFVYNKSFGKYNYNLQLFVKSVYDTYSIAKCLQEKIPEIERLDIFRIYEGYSKQIIFQDLNFRKI